MNLRTIIIIIIDDDILNHPCLLPLGTEVDLKHMCGFMTMLKIDIPRTKKTNQVKETTSNA